MSYFRLIPREFTKVLNRAKTNELPINEQLNKKFNEFLTYFQRNIIIFISIVRKF